MKPNGEKEKSITLNLKAGVIKYKFHRGNWFTVEKQFMGDEVPDRIVKISKDTLLKNEVDAWRDEFYQINGKLFPCKFLDTIP